MIIQEIIPPHTPTKMHPNNKQTSPTFDLLEKCATS